MPLEKEELREAYFGGMTPNDARALCGVSRRTWGRWMRGLARVPRSALLLLRICAQGELPAAGPEWDGWRFYRGALLTPEGVEVKPGEIRAMPYLWALVAELQREKAGKSGIDIGIGPVKVVPLNPRQVG